MRLGKPTLRKIGNRLKTFFKADKKMIWLGVGIVCLAYGFAAYEFSKRHHTSQDRLENETELGQFQCPEMGEKDRGPWRETLEIKAGETLVAVLLRLGLNHLQVHEMVKVLRPLFNPRSLKIGQTLEVSYDVPASKRPIKAGGKICVPYDLLEISIRPFIHTRFRVVQQKGQFVALKETIQLKQQKTVISGSIFSSLYQDALGKGASVQALHEMIRAFSYDVNFQLDFQPGDTFALYYETWVDEETGMAQPGPLEAATLNLSGRLYQIYRYPTPSGDDFFNEKGGSVRKALLKTPVDGARLSSVFGKRVHPVLGFTTQHKGVDFAAPTGTEIKAAGQGIIERASRYGSYGNYILIRHDNPLYKTAYAHLSRYAKDIRPGKRVKQGEVIGYVGMTGRATGPHLHFEVIKGGVHINPRSIQLMPGQTLQGAALKKFKQHVQRLQQHFKG